MAPLAPLGSRTGRRMRIRKPDPVAIPTTATLTFRGLDICDGCGGRLDAGDRLCGLCAACLGGAAHGTSPFGATARRGSPVGAVERKGRRRPSAARWGR